MGRFEFKSSSELNYYIHSSMLTVVLCKQLKYLRQLKIAQK